MTPEFRQIAMLLDGDNAQPSLLEHVLAETAKYGIVTTRRIYGDWTTPNMSGWKESLHTHAIQPVQQFRYTTGKNATDSALIIEAMDLLHAGTVGGFCIVSSDSDYTRLAMRIREEGMFVMGVGRSNTIKSFAHACNIFVHTEDLLAQSGHKANRNDLTPHGVPPVVSECEEMKSESKVKHETSSVQSESAKPAKKKAKNSAHPEWSKTVKQAVKETAADEGWADMAAVGSRLHQLKPGFKSSKYGPSKLSTLIETKPDLFETKKADSTIKVRVRS